jgi:hypothetical protein
MPSRRGQGKLYFYLNLSLALSMTVLLVISLATLWFVDGSMNVSGVIFRHGLMK